MIPDTVEKRIYVFAALLSFVTAIWVVTEQVGMARERQKHQIVQSCAQDAQWRDADNAGRCR